MSIELVPLSSIFEIIHGHKLDLNKMSKCGTGEQSVAFIGRSGERNGFVGFVEVLDTEEPYESGLITVALGGSALSSFVQPLPFYTAQNIDVLRPHSAMSLDSKLYYCLCIEANRFRYSTFGREANRTLKAIKIPALRHIPSWVSGASKTAVSELSDELMRLIERDVVFGGPRRFSGVAGDAMNKKQKPRKPKIEVSNTRYQGATPEDVARVLLRPDVKKR